MANLILTPEWTEGIYQLETSDLIIGGPDGVDNRQAIQLGKRTEWLKKEVEKRAPNTSPAFTGTPTAPTAPQTVNNGQIATTAFVKAAIAALVGSAPATLDTLAEIATALGSDGNLKATLLAEIGKKASATDFTTLKDLLIGIPFPYPLTGVPSGCLAFNGQTFSTTTYPELAKKYTSGKLPDLRGEFIRGWDNGRGVDSGRGLLSLQSDAIRNMKLSFNAMEQGGFNGVWTSTPSLVSGTIKIWNASESGTTLPGSIGSLALNAEGTPFKLTTGGFMSANDYHASVNLGLGQETRPRNLSFQYICLAK